MSKCVYCLKTEKETLFKNREHVIPQFLGGFEPQTPILRGDYVCDDCNSQLSPLETNFKEDSYEGVYTQMLNLEKTNSVRIRGINVDMNTMFGFGDRFFDEMFPFLKYENDLAVVDFQPQVKIRNYRTGYQVFTYKSLLSIKESGGKTFRDVQERLKSSGPSDIAIFTASSDGTPTQLDALTALLRNEYKLSYNEKERLYAPTPKLEERVVEIDFACTFSTDLLRVIAKIAFNYFVYCTSQENSYYTSLLYTSNFDSIRNFIRYGTGDSREIVNISPKKAILRDEGDGSQRINAHTILFTLKGGTIYSRISIFGCFIYEIVLGRFPLRTIQANFGCGHTFNPFSRRIHAIGPIACSITRLIDDGYGWYKV